MAQNIDWTGLDWGAFSAPDPWNTVLPTGSLAREIGGSMNNLGDVPQHFWDKQYHVPYSQQNDDLFRSLGFTGNSTQTITDPEFGGQTTKYDPAVFEWMKNNGIGENVGHIPGTSPGGRPEFWGYFGKDGAYLPGQADPAMSMSDTLMDQVAMFAMLAGPLLSATGAIGGGAGAGAGAAAGELGATLPTLADYGLNALSSIGTDAAASFLGTAGSAGGAVASNVLPSVLSTGAAAGGSMLPGLLSGGAALGSAWQSPGFTGQAPEMLDRVEVQGNAQQPPPNTGGLLGGGAGLVNAGAPPAVAQPPAQPSASLDRVEVIGNSTPPPSEPLVPPLVLPDIPYTNPLPTQGIDKSLSQTPTEVGKDPTLDGNSTLPDWLKGLIDPVKNAVGGGQNLAGLIGAGLGATQGGGTNTATSQSKMDPRMDQYVYGSGFGDPNSIMGGGYGLWQQNKSGINPTMQQGLDMQRAALTDPAYGDAFTQMRNLGQGLMGAPIAGNPFTNGSGGLLAGQQPTAQAGGPGGLLGGGADDRMKALMARGRGLMG